MPIFGEFRNIKEIILEFYLINGCPEFSVAADIIGRRKRFQKLMQNPS